MNVSAKSIVPMFFLAAMLISCKKENSIQVNEDSVKKSGITAKSLYSIVPTNTPASLYLIISPNTSIELVKSGDVFHSEHYIPLQEKINYYFSTKADGSGISYFINETLSAYVYADDDKVSWDNPLLELTGGEGTFQVARSQAYKMAVDFSSNQLTWQYHNIKLFYYTDWDQRTEELLTYKHPLTFEKLLQLPADNNMKFYSVTPDWLEWGASDPQSLTGSIPAVGGVDIVAVKDAGSYLVSMTLDNNLTQGTYSFIKEPTLPITLASFTAKYINKAVQLNWITSSENNVEGFEIERSEDGKTMITLPIFTTAGNFTYTLSDKSALSNKIYYYRLKTIDLDGAIQLSKFVAVKTKM